MDPRRATPWIALIVLALVGVVYFTTMYPAVPFWDAGEFIAVSKILGIPHPPGTPFYVLIGRVATLMPFGSDAQRINGLSALAGTLAIVVTYLTIVRLALIALGPERRERDGWMAHVGAVFGALMLAFSDSFWENSIEAEVYALMSFAQILVLWLGLRWWEAHEENPTAGPLLLCVYIIWLSVGLHLGVGIMGLPLLVLVFLVDRNAGLVFVMPFLAGMLVTMGLEKMAGGVLAVSALIFLVYASRGKVSWWAAGGSAAGALFVLPAALGDKPITPTLAVIALLSVLVPLVLLAMKGRAGKLIAIALFLMVAGYSTHAYLPIRAAQNPAINEGNPSNWDRLRDLLERKQYGRMDLLDRRGMTTFSQIAAIQLDKEFWRYFKRQWLLWTSPADERRLVPLGALLPLLLGLLGAGWQAARDRTSFATTFMFVGLSTAGMIVFLNFSPNEVRERDYFFQSGYHAFSLWIGLGGVFLLGWVRDSFRGASLKRGMGIATAAILIALPFVLMKTMWYTHDRRGNYVAADYARNMLEPLARDSFIFTNGDNDTFPLWYLQEVEGIRKDVRVVNLSLLNTDWYIRQLRDLEPKVPMQLTDQDIERLGVGAVQSPDGRIIYTNEFMVDHIMRMNRTAEGGWKRQPYFAVTVPEHHGFDPYFTLEGLVYRVNPDTLGPQVDVPVTEKALYETFKYRGLFTEDGSWDLSVYKDENASTLSRNYAAAHLQLAFYYRRNGNLPKAITEMERVSRMFPDYVDVLIPLGGFYLDVGDTTKAVQLFRNLASRDPNNADARYYYGVTLVYLGDLSGALREFESCIQIDPNHNQAYYAAFYTLKEAGEIERGIAYLERWVTNHPSDLQARQLLEQERGLAGLRSPVAPPRTPLTP